LGYETSYQAAERQNFFRNNVLIKQFAGLKKETTLLEIESNKVEIKKELKYYPYIRNQIIGAKMSYYDKKALDPFITNLIHQFEDLEKELEIKLSYSEELHLFYTAERDFILKSMSAAANIGELESIIHEDK
jgi:hypothetical protein